MRISPLAGVLFSLLISCGVAEANEPQRIGSGPIVTKYKDSQGRDCTMQKYANGQEETDCLIHLDKHNGVVIEKKPKEVVIPYDDFLKMVAMKEHSDKTRDKALAENTVLVKLKDEQGTVIQLQQEDIQACREIVKSHEQLGETEQQISKAVEAELRKGLETEKRLSRYKSEAFYATGIIAAIAYLTRR